MCAITNEWDLNKKISAELMCQGQFKVWMMGFKVR